MEMVERIAVLDALRGLASISVVWFHLVSAMQLVPKNTILYRSGAFGWVGVEAFFVISGFVIPYSLDRSGYRVQQYRRFLAKRLLRLDPPYIATIFVIIVVALHYSRAWRQPFPFTAPQLLLHLGYLNTVAGYQWIDPVFWTLAVEFQYYLLIGLLFPFVRNSRTFWLVVVPSSVLLSLAIPSGGLIFRYLPLFLIGLAVFHHRRRELRVMPCIFACMVFTLVGWKTVGLLPAVVGLLTGLAIAFVTWVPRTLAGFGSISYSLYLIHGTVGYTIGLEWQLRHSSEQVLTSVLMGLSASIAAAYLLYRLVEVPARRLSASIRYEHPTEVLPPSIKVEYG
jgi:peptidoglycan/LPS O-acetylase OafA/YrhL